MELNGSAFADNGANTRVLSGAIHYFRIPCERWRDSINKARLMGLNTIETYIPWNAHEMRRGQYDFTGMLDISAFLDEIKKAGMHAIVRPSPYICAEWDFGGLPAWLLSDSNIRLRCMDELYINEVSRWYDKLIPILARHTAANGGAIFAVQVENEYGSFGNDSSYLRWMKEKMECLGLKDVLYFTSDGPEDWMLSGGTLADVYKVANFGSGADRAMQQLSKLQPDKPFMCGEFWNGWFDFWGGNSMRHERSNEDCVSEMDKILALGGSLNLYMLHGGTNFGFMAGANCNGAHYTPDTTSYDYGAPLDECGDITDKYLLMRECLKKYTNVPDEPLPAPSRKLAYPDIKCSASVRLFDSLDDISKKRSLPCPYNMERLGQGYGYILYRTRIAGPRAALPIVLQDVRDRALVFADGQLLGITDRNNPQEFSLAVPECGVTLDVLVESLGRVNYGIYMKDFKGITDGIRHGQQFLFGYDIYNLPMENLCGLRFQEAMQHSDPAFYRFSAELCDSADTYLDMSGWGKGFVTLNGFNLGRYWDIGPQSKLFVPASLLRNGRNEFIVFEERNSRDTISFSGHA